MSSYQTPTYPSVDNVPPTTYPYGYQPTQQVPTFPTQQVPQFPQIPVVPTLPAIETSYIENILRLNLGKVATVYMNFENSQWGSKVFKGVLRAAGKDHIILVDQETGIRYLLPTIYLSYITFDVPITYQYPFDSVQPGVPPTQIPTPGPYTQLRKKENQE